MNGYCTPDLDPMTDMDFYELAIKLTSIQNTLSDLQSKKYKIQNLMETKASELKMFKNSPKALISKTGATYGEKYPTLLVNRKSSSEYEVIGEPDIEIRTFN